jgi:hypothetical protein
MIKTILLAGASVLAMGGSAAAVTSCNGVFGFTGGPQSCTVETAGLYKIVALGAQGGGGGGGGGGHSMVLGLISAGGGRGGDGGHGGDYFSINQNGAPGDAGGYGNPLHRPLPPGAG